MTDFSFVNIPLLYFETAGKIFFGGRMDTFEFCRKFSNSFRRTLSYEKRGEDRDFIQILAGRMEKSCQHFLSPSLENFLLSISRIYTQSPLLIM